MRERETKGEQEKVREKSECRIDREGEGGREGGREGGWDGGRTREGVCVCVCVCVRERERERERETSLVDGGVDLSHDPLEPVVRAPRIIYRLAQRPHLLRHPRQFVGL